MKLILVITKVVLRETFPPPQSVLQSHTRRQYFSLERSPQLEPAPSARACSTLALAPPLEARAWLLPLLRWGLGVHFARLLSFC